MKKHIPNFITSLNLFTGCLAVYFAFQSNYAAAFLCILIAGVFDFMDGFAARLLKAYSPMGKELDSLADVISFGLTPGVIVFSALSSSALPHYLAFAAFIMTVFSALRLAKFNIDERQSESFIGLNTPANAIFWGASIYSFGDFYISQPYLLLALAMLFSLLLVAEFPMFSLKIKGLSWSKSKVQYIFLIGCIVLLIILRLDAFSAIIAWYILFSIILNFIHRKKASEKEV